MSDQYVGNGVRFLRSQDVLPYRILTVDNKFISEDFHKRLSKSKLSAGDVVIVRTGKPGTCAVMPRDLGECNCSDLVIVRPGTQIDPRYLCYFINGVAANHVTSWTVGAVQQHFNVGAAREMPIPLPPLAEQRRISAILGSLDEKIELNRRMNATLEEMARALFRSWFVDFDPVKVKARGGDPTSELGLSPEIAALFPDSVQDSPLGPIPAGWGVGRIAESCERIQNGGTPRRDQASYWENGNIPWLTSGEVRQPLITHTGSFITENGLVSSSAKWVPAWSTVIALYGATAGQVSLLAVPVTTNQAVCALAPKVNREFFVYLWMSGATGELEGKAVGSAQQNISKGIVEETHTVTSPQLVLGQFSSMLRPLFELQAKNLVESKNLAETRDYLLPRLLSGSLCSEVV